MKEFLNFVITYWREIASIIGLAASIVICCIRKRPVQVVDTLKETILSLLPYCIRSAESQPKGSKKDFCLNLLTSLLKEMGIALPTSYLEFAAEQVEIILSTPQKKGIK